MGQEQSTPVDESVPAQTLKDRSLSSIAQYIKSGKAKNIVVMVRDLVRSVKTKSDLTIHRSELVLALQLVFQISALQIQASTQI